MMKTTFNTFQATRVWTGNLDRDFPDLGYGLPGGSSPCGFVYNGNLFIEMVNSYGFKKEDAEFTVELFGGDFQGNLLDCEVELYAAAKNEGVLPVASSVQKSAS